MSKFFKIVSVVCICSFIVSCNPDEGGAPSQVLQIVGDDNRTQLSDKTMRTALGAFLIDGQASCTAFATSSLQVVTAAHCYKGVEADQKYSFKTDDGVFALQLKQLIENADVAIFELEYDVLQNFYEVSMMPPQTTRSSSEGVERPLTQLVSVDIESMEYLITETGYMRNFGDQGGESSGIYLHTLDTLPGSSGSPILQNGKVVAVHLGSIGDSDNYAVGYSRLNSINLDGHLDRSQISAEVSAVEIYSVIGTTIGITAVIYEYFIKNKDKGQDTKDAVNANNQCEIGNENKRFNRGTEQKEYEFIDRNGEPKILRMPTMRIIPRGEGENAAQNKEVLGAKVLNIIQNLFVSNVSRSPSKKEIKWAANRLGRAKGQKTVTTGRKKIGVGRKRTQRSSCDHDELQWGPELDINDRQQYTCQDFEWRKIREKKWIGLSYKELGAEIKKADIFTSSKVFDVKFYLNKYSDLKRIYGSNLIGARKHWVTQGIKEGRIGHPKFSVKHYIKRYSDLKRAFGKDYKAAVNHYVKKGGREGRSGKY